MMFDVFFVESGVPAEPPLVMKGRRRWRAAPSGPTDVEFRCSRCKRWIPEGGFWVDRTDRLRRSVCRVCSKLAIFGYFDDPS